MSDLTEDYYDDRVIEFLNEKGVANARFIVAVDENGRAHAFAGPQTKFRKIQNAGDETEDPRGNSCWWNFQNSPGVTAETAGGSPVVTAGIGGTIVRWP